MKGAALRQLNRGTVAVRGAEWVFARLCQFPQHADHGHRPLLKLHGIAACIDRDINKAIWDFNVAGVVDANFGNQVGGLIIANKFRVDWG